MCLHCRFYMQLGSSFHRLTQHVTAIIRNVFAALLLLCLSGTAMAQNYLLISKQGHTHRFRIRQGQGLWLQIGEQGRMRYAPLDSVMDGYVVFGGQLASIDSLMAYRHRRGGVATVGTLLSKGGLALAGLFVVNHWLAKDRIPKTGMLVAGGVAAGGFGLLAFGHHTLRRSRLWLFQTVVLTPQPTQSGS